MNGNYSNRRNQYSPQPRLPPLVKSPTYRDQPPIALIEQSYQGGDMQALVEERRARQMLDDQIKVITQVCKKLNHDIESLESQMNEKNFAITNLEFKYNDLQANNSSLVKDLQFKYGRHETSLSKIEGEHLSVMNSLKDIQQQFQDYNRSSMLRINDLDSRISELSNKFESVLMEQTIVMKNVEGDTVKQLQLLDSKTRTMLEDIRNQLNHTRSINETEMSKLESRLLEKIGEISRNTEKYDRLDRKIDDNTQSFNKRFLGYEDDFQRKLNNLSSTIEKLENKVNQGIEDKFTKSANDVDKLKKDLKSGLADVEQAIEMLQKVIEGKIKISEDRLEKEIDKIKKMVVLM